MFFNSIQVHLSPFIQHIIEEEVQDNNRIDIPMDELNEKMDLAAEVDEIANSM